MNPRYIQTLRQHLLLFLLPIGLTITASVWMTLGTPNRYAATATLWSDTPGGDSGDLYSGTTAALRDQSLLLELLGTQSFINTVATKSKLDTYLSQNATSGWGPLQLMSRLRGQKALGDRVSAELNSSTVGGLVVGPHVWKVTYVGPTPELTTKTLQATLDQLADQRIEAKEKALSGYQKALSDASASLERIKAQISNYVKENPNSGKRDPQLELLLQAQAIARKRADSSKSAIRSQSTAFVDPNVIRASLRVIDPPGTAVAVKGLRTIAMSIIVGFIAGLFLSLLALVAVVQRNSAREKAIEIPPYEPTDRPRYSSSFDEPQAHPERVPHDPTVG